MKGINCVPFAQGNLVPIPAMEAKIHQEYNILIPNQIIYLNILVHCRADDLPDGFHTCSLLQMVWMPF